MTAPSSSYPGISAVVDGSEAVLWVDTHVTDGACAYPITPSSRMSDGYQRAVANGGVNLWGEHLWFIEAESEHSAASVCEGYALAGGRVSSFTAGQGLVLMKEVLYVISGKRLPAVFHIGARAISSQALNVHAGHDDVMGVTDTGWGMLFARNAQQAHDFALIARRVAERSRTPFLNIQDGFLTTHTVERALLAEPELMKDYVGDPRGASSTLFDPRRPLMTGTVQNQEYYMEGRLAQRSERTDLAIVLREAFTTFAGLTGRTYDMLDAYRMDDANYVLITMGSLSGTAIATADALRADSALRVGVLAVNSFRPFPGSEIVDAIRNCRAVAVLERTDNPLARNNPLTSEIKAELATAASEGLLLHMPRIYSGVYGLGGRDTTVADLAAAVRHMSAGGARFFSLNANHESALSRGKDTDACGGFTVRGHSIGGYGSISASRILAALFGEALGFQVKAAPRHGSEKKGLPTGYHLIVSTAPIDTQEEPAHADCVVIHDECAFALGDPLSGVREGGTVLLQIGPGTEAFDGLRTEAARRGLKVYALDALGLAADLSVRPDLAVRMQGVVMIGAFLKVARGLYGALPEQETLLQATDRYLRRQFKRASETTLAANLKAVRCGYDMVRPLFGETLTCHAKAFL
ncbi:MAG: 2-oxoacid:acceptor oxidoreductase family protein [Acidiferrobacteraceae bacterium]